MKFDIFRRKKGKKEDPPKQEETRGKAPKIRVVFMGTPEFAEIVLGGLIEGGFALVAVYTQPDKPAGRKQEVSEPPVKILALGNAITVEQPDSFDEVAIEKLKSYKPDLIVVAAYGKILPKAVLDIPGFGCLNIHASLLPRWRGASPVQNTLLSGETETGVTVMLMDEGLDTGSIVAQKVVPIEPDDNTETLLPKLAREGVRLLVDKVPLWIERKLEATPQDEEHATLCSLIEREDGRIFWNKSAESIANRYRALSPWPGIFTFWKQNGGEFMRLKLPQISWQKTNPVEPHRLGEVFEVGEKIAVQTREGLVFLEEIQASGKTRVPARDFVNGYPNFLGTVLE